MLWKSDRERENNNFEYKWERRLTFKTTKQIGPEQLKIAKQKDKNIVNLKKDKGSKSTGQTLEENNGSGN